MKNKIKWGIIGGGRIVQWFLQDWKYTTNKDAMLIYGIWNRTKSKAEKLAQQYSIENVFDDYSQLLNPEKIDIVYIGTNHASHYQFAKAALERKIAVYCEKPITMKLSQAEELYALAKEKKVLFLDGIKTGIIPAFQKMYQDIQDGLIGDIDYVYAPYIKMSSSLKVANPNPGEENGGMLYGAGVYPLFISHFLLGKPVKTQVTSIRYPRNKDIQKSYIVETFENNKVGIVACSDKTVGSLQAEIHGTKGYIILAGNLEKFNQPYHLDILHCPFTYQIWNLRNKKIKEEVLDFQSDGEGLRFLIDHCYQLLINHQIESPVISADTSLSILSTIEKAANSN